MTKVKIILLTLTLALLLLPILTSNANNIGTAQPRENWWMTYQGNDHRTGFTDRFAPADNEIIWCNDTIGAVSAAGLVLWRNYLIISSTNGKLYIINTENGKLRRDPILLQGPSYCTPWLKGDGSTFAVLGDDNGYLHKVNFVEGSSTFLSVGEAIRATPIVFRNDTEDIIFTVTVGGNAYWVNFSNLALITSLSLESGVEIVGSPTIGSDNIAYIAGKVGLTGRLYVVNLENATLLNTYEFDSGEYPTATPVYYEGKIYVPCGDGRIRVFNEAGEEVDVIDTGSSNSINAPPAIAYDKIIVCVGSEVKCIDISSGSEEILWSYDTGDTILAAPLFYENNCTIVVSNNSFVYCLDVNNDGNLIWSLRIGLPGNYYSTPAAGSATIFLVDPSGDIYRIGSKSKPVITSISRSIESPAYNETVAVNATIVENSWGVEQAYLVVWDSVTGDEVTYEMSLINGDEYNGIWQANITGRPWPATVRYYVKAVSASGLDSSSDEQEYSVRDPYPPIVSDPTISPSSPTYMDEVVVTVTIEEPENASGVRMAWLTYGENSTGSTRWHSIGMEYAGDNVWSATIPAYPWRTNVTLYVEAHDEAGNAANSTIIGYIVGDNFSPVIADVSHEPEVPGVNETVIVRTFVEDNGSGVSYVTLVYNYGLGNIATNMTLDRGTIYHGYWVAEIPRYVHEYGVTVNYFIKAVDRAGKISFSSNYTYTVADTIPPSILSVAISPEAPQYFDTVNVSAHVIDRESSVARVILKFYTSVNPTHVSRIMSSIGGGIYIAQIPQFSYGVTVYYWVEAEDNSGNVVTSDVYSYTVADLVPPVIVNVTYYPKNPTVDDKVTVKVTAYDDGSGIDEVMLRYYDGKSWHEMLMTEVSPGEYEEAIPKQKANTVVKFKIVVYDKAGNEATYPEVEDEFISYKVREIFPGWLVPAVAILVPVLILLALLIMKPELRQSIKEKFGGVVEIKVEKAEEAPTEIAEEHPTEETPPPPPSETPPAPSEEEEGYITRRMYREEFEEE
ncbi:hypothetical protein DRO02_03015 [archaeon]|nr:MAG: hypothetical protein DRO21_02880 [archaeon]RLG65026.1 MAG: hypothetical protein DRO02_03015 [archaeon]